MTLDCDCENLSAGEVGSSLIKAAFGDSYIYSGTLRTRTPKKDPNLENYPSGETPSKLGVCRFRALSSSLGIDGKRPFQGLLMILLMI